MNQTISNGVNSNSIENMLSDWGRAQHALPKNNQTLKSQILDKLPVLAAPIRSNIKPWRLPWLSIAFAGMAVISLFLVSAKNNPGIQSTTYQSVSTEKKSEALTQAPTVQPKSVAMGQDGSALSHSAAPSAMVSGGAGESYAQRANSLDSAQGLKVRPYAPDLSLPPQDTTQVPSSDNREFLKTDYAANIQTHHVEELASRIQTTVKGFDGRVDSSNATQESAYLSFVLPASKFEAFRQELTSLVGKRFIAERVQTENMLPEKRSIEDQQKTFKDQLTELNSQKNQLTQTHKQTTSSLQSQINTASKELASLQNQQPDTLELEAQKQTLVQKINSLRVRLANENSNYQNQLSYFDAQTQSTQKNLDNANTQNSDLLDTVATVRGSIYISYINWWEVLNHYIGGYWIAIILGLMAIAAYFASRRSQIIIP